MKDGMILIYCKDNQALPVAMSNEQYQTLQTILPVIFGNETIQVVNKPLGEIYNMIGEKEDIPSPPNPDINEKWNLPEDILAMDSSIKAMAELISEYRFRYEAQTKPEMESAEKIIEDFMDKARDDLEKQKS